jgi:hypothetical protein
MPGSQYEAADCSRIEGVTPEWQPELSVMAYLVTTESLSTLHFESSCHTGYRKLIPVKPLWSWSFCYDIVGHQHMR